MNKQESKKLFSSILSYCESKYKITLSGKSSIKLNSTTYTARQFSDKFKKEESAIADYMGGKYEMASLLHYVKGDRSLKSDDEAMDYISDKVFTLFHSRLLESSKKKHINIKDSDIVSHRFDWTSHFPIMDVKSRQRVMYDSANKVVDHATSYSAWKEYTYTLKGEGRQEALAASISGSVTYDPYDITEVQYKDLGDQKDIVHVNAHRTPKWRLSEVKNPTLPKEFVQLMEVLFPGERCRSYVYHWMNFMMTSRNQCYLLLHGEQGIGKNTLALIMEKLVGSENYSYIMPTFFDPTNKFNSELKFKRCVFFDEAVITEKTLSMFRSFTNTYLAITEKGVDTIPYTNYNSYVVANNLDKTNHIVSEDRRYSTPILGKTPIKSVYGIEWLDRFYELIENEEFIGNIGHWILQNGDQGEFNEKQPYITSTFYDMVDKALTNWQTVLIEQIVNSGEEEIRLSGAISAMGMSNPPGRTKIGNFLDSHKDREGDSYGYLGQSHDGERVIKINKKYWDFKKEEPLTQEEEEVIEEGDEEELTEYDTEEF